MSVELTQEVSSRLSSERFGWLTTVSKSGQPIPRLVWFSFDGERFTMYSSPQAPKVAHIRSHPEVSLNLDSDGHGFGTVVIAGIATVDATDVDCRDDISYWAKYSEDAKQFGLTEALGSFSARITITPTKVWFTPTR